MDGFDLFACWRVWNSARYISSVLGKLKWVTSGLIFSIRSKTASRFVQLAAVNNFPLQLQGLNVATCVENNVVLGGGGR